MGFGDILQSVLLHIAGMTAGRKDG